MDLNSPKIHHETPDLENQQASTPIRASSASTNPPAEVASPCRSSILKYYYTAYTIWSYIWMAAFFLGCFVLAIVLIIQAIREGSYVIVAPTVIMLIAGSIAGFQYIIQIIAIRQKSLIMSFIANVVMGAFEACLVVAIVYVNNHMSQKEPSWYDIFGWMMKYLLTNALKVLYPSLVFHTISLFGGAIVTLTLTKSTKVNA